MRSALLCVFVGCAHPTLAPRLAEGTTVLKPGQVGLTIDGGGGTGSFDIGGNAMTARGVGAEGRVRLGLAHDQEIGLSAVAAVSLPHTSESVVGGYASYKIAPKPWLAFVAELGALDKIVSTTAIFAGSVAAIVAPYTSSGGSQLYAGLKGSLAIPVLQDATARTELIALPVGYSWHMNESIELIGEVGFGLGFEQVDSGGTTTETSGYGGYGLLAFGYKFR